MTSQPPNQPSGIRQQQQPQQGLYLGKTVFATFSRLHTCAVATAVDIYECDQGGKGQQKQQEQCA